MLLKTPSKFKQSHGGTPKPQTALDAPFVRGPFLIKNILYLTARRVIRAHLQVLDIKYFPRQPLEATVRVLVALKTLSMIRCVVCDDVYYTISTCIDMWSGTVCAPTI